MVLLRIHVHVTAVQEVVSPGGTARMVLFSGNCDGDYFQGTIEPGGVDTQLAGPDGTGTLSARYMLTGTDREGRSARMFIQNEARFGEETHPRIWTDSPCLAFLESADLIGHIGHEDGHLLITIETAS